MRAAVILLLASRALCPSTGLMAQGVLTAQSTRAAPLSIGETFSIESSVLGESRRVNVYIPLGYPNADVPTLPVLYMPDGGIGEDFLHIAGLVQISVLNGTMSPFLLVGIENTERRRDLTGPTESASDREIAPRVGGSANFRAFVRDELMPYIRATYPTSDEAAIVGESLAGLFVVETLVQEPDLFDTYIAIDPSLWWDGARLVDEGVERVLHDSHSGNTLFLASSDEPTIAELTARMAAALGDSAPSGLRVHYVPFPTETHGTIYHPAALVAFRSVFAPPPD